MENWFADIGLDAEEPVIEGPPLRKEKMTFEARMVINIPASENFLRACKRRILLRKWHELLAVDMELLDLSP